MIRPRMPLVDPDYLIEESDPEMLDAHARWLLQQLRQIHADGSKEGYNITIIKAATCQILDGYVQIGAIHSDIASLAREFIKPDAKATYFPVREINRKPYWAAISYEAKYPADPNGREPSTATKYAIAKHVRKTVGFAYSYSSQKTCVSIIRGWRKLDHYRINVAFQRTPSVE